MALLDEYAPRPLHIDRPPADDSESIPVRIEAESSDRISRTLHAQASGNGEMSPEKFLESLVMKLAETNTGNGSGGDGAPPSGSNIASPNAWAKKVAGVVAALGVFLFTWYNTVNRDLADKATRGYVQQVVDKQMGGHSDKTHPDTAVRLKALEREQRTIRDSQIRQETIDKVQTTTLKEIRDDVRRIRFGRR